MKEKKRRILSIFTVLAMTVSLLFGNMFINTAAAEVSMSLYVSLSGSDSNTGTIDQPFRTVEKARDAIRALKSGGGLPDGGVTVYIRGGIYSLTGSIAFTAEDSGEPGKPVVYTAYPGEKVSFMGGYSLIPVDFAPVTDPAVLGRLPDAAESHILTYDLAAHGMTQYGSIPKNGYGWPKTAPAPELFIDNRSMTLARYPNSGYITISSVVSTGFIPRDYCSDMPKGDPSNPEYVPESEWLNQPGPVFKYSDEHLDNWAQEPEGWVGGYWYWDWADDNLKIAGIDTSTNTITATYPSFYGCRSGQRFYGYNMLCELDAPGEWYLDRVSGKLYIYSDNDISGSTIQISTLRETMVTMNQVANVNIQGITFETTCGKGISMMDCESCTITGCTICRTGMRAIEIGTGDEESPESPDYFNLHGGHNNSVISCDIYETGMGGIFVAGGDRQTLTPGNNKVENCNIWDFSRLVRTGTPAINMGGCGNIARHNLIHNAPHFAIQFMGNDMLIEYNEIYKVLLETGDSGVIYSGRDWSYRGNVIRYNYIHDIPTTGNIGSFAIYMDDCMSTTEIYGNVFCNIASRAFLMGGGRDHRIYNNIIIDSGGAIDFDARAFESWYDNVPTQMTRLNNMPFMAEPWASRYPALAATNGNVEVLKVPAGNVIEKNAYVNTADGTIVQMVVDNGTITNNKHYSASQDVGFADKANRDFNLRPDSIIYTDIPGFQSIPYSDIGIYADSYRSAANTTGEFDLIAPENGAVNIDPVGFRPVWSVSEGAERYRLLVSKTADFTDIVVNSYTNTNNADSLSMILPENTTLYWKVEACLYSDLWHAGRSSSTRSFTTAQAPSVLFSDGFEDGLGNWTVLAGFPAPSISTAQYHSGAKSVQMSSDITVISHTFDKSYNNIVSIWFYDDASKTSRYTQAVARADDGVKCLSMGVSGDISSTKYYYRIDTAEAASNITRTTGWHELKWDYTSGTGVSMYIDGTLVVTSDTLTSFSKIAIGDYWSGGTSSLFFDDVSVYSAEQTPDTLAPIVSNGTITSSNVTQTGATLNWDKASDDVSAQGALQYRVYSSTSNNINSVGNIEANGTASSDYIADISSYNAAGLTAGTTYYFNIIVKDEAGNKSCYSMTSVTTQQNTVLMFSDSFEDGLGSWTVLAGFPAPSISTAQYHSGAKSVQMSSDITVISHAFDKGYNGVVSIWFYDDASKTSRYMQNVARADDGVKCVSMGVCGDVSSTKYYYRTDATEAASNITRTTGWHELKWDYTSGTGVSMYIDGTLVASSGALTSFSKIAIGDYWSGGTSSLFFDDVSVYAPESAPGQTPDNLAPTISYGAIAGSNVTHTGATLGWNKASDEISAQETLQYRVYYSTSNNIDTVENAEANGTALSDYVADISSYYVTGLTANTVYYFVVIVKDEAGNKSCYNMTCVTTQPEPIMIFSDGFEDGLGNWTALAGFPAPLISTARYHSGAKSLQMSSDITVISHTFDKSYNNIVSIWFYDDAGKTSRYTQNVARADDGVKCVSMGVSGDISALKYIYRIDATEAASNITRTTGWHELKWDYTSGTGVSMYIDGVLIASSDALTSFSKIAIGDYWSGGRSNLFFDDVSVYALYNSAPKVSDGVIAGSNVTKTGATLSWNKADDDISVQEKLQYRVYYSTSNNIDTIEKAEANGTTLSDFVTDINSMDVTGLAAWTTYYFNIIVKDESGEKSCYSMTSLTTLSALEILSPVDGAAYCLNQEVLADWNTGNSGAGISSEAGTVAKGSVIDTGSAGIKTFIVTVTDNNGLTVTKTVSYNVVYSFEGFLQPEKNDKAFKAGRNIPVKFQLKNVNGDFVTNAVAKLYYAKIENDMPGQEYEAVSSGSANGANVFRYDPVDNRYIFNLNTKDWPAGTYQMKILLDDGRSYTEVIAVE